MKELNYCNWFKPKGKIEIIQSDGMPWNAWIYYYDDDGSLLSTYFLAGGYMLYLECRCKEEGDEEACRQLRELEKEWERYNSYDP